MDVCCDIFVKRLRESPGVVVVDRDHGHYRWGRHAELLERPVPAHIQRRLPAELAATLRSYSLRGDALDLLASEVNGVEVDWQGHTLVDLLRRQLRDDESWAFVFEWHGDQIDYVVTEGSVDELVERLSNNLDWNVTRKGFISVHMVG